MDAWLRYSKVLPEKITELVKGLWERNKLFMFLGVGVKKKEEAILTYLKKRIVLGLGLAKEPFSGAQRTTELREPKSLENPMVKRTPEQRDPRAQKTLEFKEPQSLGNPGA